MHQHEFTTFYWGQNYGGSLTAVVMAAVFAVFGSSTATLKAVPIGMSAIAALLVWRLGRRTIGEPGATIAGLAFWVWPTDYVWLSTKERGLLLGVHDPRALVPARGAAARRSAGKPARLDRARPPRRGRLVDQPADPLLRRARADLARDQASFRPAGESWSRSACAVLGSLPWFIWNVRNDWAALVPASRQFDKGYLGNIDVLFRHGLPVALGLNVIERWIVPVVFPIIYVAIIVGGTIALAVRKPKPWFLILVAVTFPLLWGGFPVSGVVGEGRYVMFVLPAVILLLMYAARHPVAQVVLLVAALAVSIDGVHRIRCCTSPAAPDVAMPRYTGPLIDALEAHHVKHFVADYWIAYRVAFETDERIIGSPRAFKRWPPFDRGSRPIRTRRRCSSSDRAARRTTTAGSCDSASTSSNTTRATSSSTNRPATSTWKRSSPPAN